MVCFCLLQVNTSLPYFAACFSGYCDAAASTDCLTGPKPDVTTEQEVVTTSGVMNKLVGSDIDCYVSFALGRNVSVVCVWCVIKTF